MEGLTQEQIIEALSADQSLLSGVTQHIVSSEGGQEIITNKANSMYQQKIGDEIKSIYDREDSEMFEILGEKPKTLDTGGKQKTYEKRKELFSELAELRLSKDTLTKDAEVQRLTQENERLKREGGGSHWEATFNKEQEKWNSSETEYKNKISTLEKDIYSSSIRSQIDGSRSELKFNPDIPASAVEAMYNIEKRNLISNSKKDGEKIVYLREDGSAILNKEGNIATATDILKDRLKDVLLDNNKIPGGGADATIAGSIKTTKVEGKDDQRSLVLDLTTFKTRVEFQKVVTEVLKAEGISMSHKDYRPLMDQAYKDYDVAKMPRA